MSADQEKPCDITNTPTCMTSVNRIAKLPVVESTIQTAASVYEKVKDSNSIITWTCTQAENTYNLAKGAATPVVKNLEGPIKKVDGILCSGLDYVETKVPAVKLPPGEILLQIYDSTKNYVNNHVTPVVESAVSYAETARGIVEPAYQTAKTAVEPAVEKAKSLVEPLVQPAVDKAHAIVDSYLHPQNQEIHVDDHTESSDAEQ